MILLFKVYVFLTLPQLIGLFLFLCILSLLIELYEKIKSSSYRIKNTIYSTIKLFFIGFILWFGLCYIIQPETIMFFWIGILILFILSFGLSFLKYSKFIEHKKRGTAI